MTVNSSSAYLPVQKKDQKKRSHELKKAVPAGSNYFIPLLLILLFSFVAYLPVFKNGFVNWDDDKYILNNPAIYSIHLKEFFSGYVRGNYHPLTMLVYAIEYQFFGLKATGY